MVNSCSIDRRQPVTCHDLAQSATLLYSSAQYGQLLVYRERDGAPLISVKRELLPQPDAGRRDGRNAALAADEGEEILANHIGIGGEQAVREARVDLQRTVFEELGREQRRV